MTLVDSEFTNIFRIFIKQILVSLILDLGRDRYGRIDSSTLKGKGPTESLH